MDIISKKLRILMKKIFFFLFFMGGVFSSLWAECIYKIAHNSSVSVLDSKTLILKNEKENKEIVIELDCKIKEDSSIILLAEHFCNYYENVFSVDNRPCNIESVMKLN